MEQEIKLRMLDKIEIKKLLETDILVDLKGKAAKNVLLSATYYDTADQLLAKNQLAYRVRKEGRKWIGTLKGYGSYQGGMHARKEWNMEQKDDQPRLSVFTEAKLSSELLALDGKELQPLFSVETKRTIKELILSDGSKVELALDFGIIRGRGKEELIQEIEIELIEGSIIELVGLASSLAEKWNLVPEKRSKFSRGLDLVGLKSSELEPAVEKLDDEMPASLGATKMLVSQTNQLLKCVEEGSWSDCNEEWLHRFRVRLRQLRTLLILGQEFLDKDEVASWQEKLQECFRATGPVREMDVLESFLLDLPDDGIGSGRLAARIQERRSELIQSLQKEWGFGRWTALLLGLWSWLLVEEKKIQEANAIEKQSLEKWAVEVMNGNVRELWKQRKESDFSDFKWCHDLRISAKKLRYGLECLEEFLPIRETKQLLVHLELLQEDLGRIQDGYCSKAWLTQLLDAKSHKDMYREAGLLTGWLLRDALRANQDASEEWERVLKRLKKWLKYVEG